MKHKIWIITIIVILLSFWGSAFAQEWRVANQVTIAWDASTTLVDGNPLPSNNVAKYRVYLANAVTDPNKSNPTLLTSQPITTLEYVVTLNVEGRFFVGVSAVRFDETDAEISESDINWSDVNGDSTPNPFGLVHYIKMGAPKNLR